MHIGRCFFILFLTLSLNSKKVSAQVSLSVGPGITSYSGDISGPNLRFIRPAVNGEVWYRLNGNFYAKAGTGIYRIYAEDVHPDRNRAFRANHYDAYLGMVYMPMPYQKVAPFFTAGIGITKVDPTHKVPLIGSEGHWWLNSSKWLPDGRPIPSPAIIFPVGLGIQVRLSNKFALVADGVLRLTNTDMLDGVGSSEVYVAQIDGIGKRYFETIRPNGVGGNDVLGNGNPEVVDSYGIFSVRLQYFIGDIFPTNKTGKKGGKILCPTYE